MTSRSFVVAAVMLPLAVIGCRRQAVETYRIPKEKDPAMGLAEPGTPPATGPMAAAAGGGSMASTPVATADGPTLTWTAPGDWKQKAASAMRKASYSIDGAGAADADFSITAFPGDVGGELANVNRWRGQLQLPPVTEAEFSTSVQRLEHDGLRFAVVELVGSGDPQQRILGAFVPYGGATWFFKLMGPAPVVERSRTAFLAFLDTVKPAAPTTQ